MDSPLLLRLPILWVFPFEDVWTNEPIQVIVTGVPSRRTYVELWFTLPKSFAKVKSRLLIWCGPAKRETG